MIQSLDHIQLVFPQGAEDTLRDFYCDDLGLREIPKPLPLQGCGGFWATTGTIDIHFGVDPDFHPARKAHPAFVATDIADLAGRLAQKGYVITWDHALADVERFFINDPVGNRIEIILQS